MCIENKFDIFKTFYRMLKFQACPSVKDAVCLVGLRPFLGVEQLLLADRYLVLLANSDGSPTHSNSSTKSVILSRFSIKFL